jgi:hypothetical protein
MENSEETRVLTQVSARLCSRFPNIPRQRVSDVVNRSYHDFDRAPIRDFVEILVERDATDLLSHGSA